MAVKVIFKRGTREQYDALAEKDGNTLYWLRDTQELYCGDVLFGKGKSASTLASGLMSAEDKGLLDSLAEAQQEAVPLSAADKEKLDGVEEHAEANLLVGVQVNGTDLSIDQNKKVNLVTSSPYNPSTNPIATMEDLPSIDDTLGLSGGTMTGDVDMDGHKVTGLDEPSDDSDAATKQYVDDAVGDAEANLLVGVQVNGTDLSIDQNKKVNLVTSSPYNPSTNPIATMEDLPSIDDTLGLSGGTMTGDVDMDGHKVTGLDEPSDDSDAATKQYVDDAVGDAEANLLVGVQVNGTDLSIDQNKKVNLVTSSPYNPSTNPIATMEDLPSIDDTLGLSGGTMTGDVDMDGHKVTGLDEPSDDSDAATKQYVDDAVGDAEANLLVGVQVNGTDLSIDQNKKVNLVTSSPYNPSTNPIATMEDLPSIDDTLGLSGGTMTGDVDMDGHKVTGLDEPSDDSDAATKQYVDDAVGDAEANLLVGVQVNGTDLSIDQNKKVNLVTSSPYNPSTNPIATMEDLLSISATEELFWCTYDVTTYAEITAALAAGKLPVCRYQDEVYVYSSYVEMSLDFRVGYFFYNLYTSTAMDPDYPTLRLSELNCDPADGWIEPLTVNILTESDNPVYLSVFGGGMNGLIDMSNHKITNLANGTVSGDAVHFGQIAGFKNITISTAAPTAADGENGDIWFVYSAGSVRVVDGYLCFENAGTVDSEGYLVPQTAEVDANGILNL